MADNQANSNRKYLIIIAILALLCVVLGVLQFTNTKEITEKSETVNNLELEQLQLKNDLQEMLIQYDTINVQNDRLNAEILGQQEQIKEMLKQIEKHKDDAYIIAKLKKETATLREIMKGYLVTIDSLNTMNRDLIKDNQFLATELSQSKSRTVELESTKRNLENIVATGSILQADGMTSVGLRVRNSGNQTEVTRANKTELIRTCTKIAENRISPAGKKTLYLRIISPDGVVLDSDDGEEGRFDFNGVSGKYSVKRVIDYNNQAQEVCIFYTVGQTGLSATGKYIVEMYESGTLIGKTDIDLK
jgi:lambda repressor-like predicted transcriptional regulator